MSLCSSELRGYTGSLYEDEFLPEVKGYASWESTGYMSRRQAMLFARNSQPRDWNPAEPHIRRASDLHWAVYKELETAGEDDASRLALYTARGSALDRFHGVDGWFEYEGRAVTIDLTLNGNKSNGYKADVTLCMSDDSEAEIAGYASTIAEYLISSSRGRAAAAPARVARHAVR